MIDCDPSVTTIVTAQSGSWLVELDAGQAALIWVGFMSVDNG